MDTKNWGLEYRTAEAAELIRKQLMAGSTIGEFTFPQKVYFVDSVNGLDTNDGLSWATPFKTIMKGLNTARRLPGSTTIDDTKDHQAWVFVAPGHYNEAIAFSAYGVHLVGLGSPVPGKDYGVSINYSGATAANAALAFGGSGNSIRNLHINVGAQALPGIWCNAGDNNLIENCVIDGDGATATHGILLYSMKGSWIRDCVISGFITTGIKLEGGADRYAIQGGIERCQIFMPTVAGAKGIYIDGNMTVYNFRVDRNFVDARGGGATGKGIDNDAAGVVFITDNYVLTDAGTPIETVPADSAGILHNHTHNATTVIDPNVVAG